MNDDVDIRGFLDEWPYDPEESVRVKEVGGRVVVQVRLPFGIEQYERDNRPDGRRPHGCESLLDYHLDLSARAGAGGKESSFVLTRAQCAELFEEGLTYYYRYLHLFELQDWVRTVRDTARNMRLFDFVKRYAVHEEDRTHLEQWRPYITRVNAVAAAMIELRELRHDRAQRIIDRTIAGLEALPEIDAGPFKYEYERSLVALRAMSRQIRKSKPLGTVERLEQDLQQAVQREEFERAAELRDRLRVLKEDGSDSVPSAPVKQERRT